MQTMLTKLEFKIVEKIYNFTCAPDSPIEHVKEALFQFQKYVGHIEDAIKAQQAAQAVIDEAEKAHPIVEAA